MDDADRLQHRLTVLDALCAAHERKAEVVAVVAAAEDADEAVAGVLRVLGLDDEHAATAVLDQQVRSWTRQARARTERVRAEVRAELAALQPNRTEVDWDARYADAEQVWSGAPNGVLVAEAAGLAPGTAVDVGCGEGADAVWLAQQGWQVTAFDVSSVALERASDHVAQAGVTVQLLHAGLLEAAPALGRFDLVNAQYPAVLHEQGRSLAALLDLVAPGGTMLFVHHLTTGAVHDGFDPADYVLPADARAALDDGWAVDVDEQRPRSVTSGAGAAHTVDVVLRARRLGAQEGTPR